MTESIKLQKSYDTIIVGNSPGALVYANALKSRGISFCIIDSQLGSIEPIKHFGAIGEAVSTDLPFQETEPAPQFFVDFMEANPFGFNESECTDGPPLSFKKGQFKSFVGFDGAKIQGDTEYLRYCKGTLSVAAQPEALLSPLVEELSPIVFNDQVTDLEFDGYRITHIVLNGAKKVAGQNFVFFDRLDWLVKRLAQVETSISTRLKKLKWLSAVHLTFHHPEPAAQEPSVEALDTEGAMESSQDTEITNKKDSSIEWNSPYLLMGSKEQPCLGGFRKTESGQTISQWQSYIPAELTMDSETTGAAVKEIKKQVKRAFPATMGKGVSEQIAVRQFDIADLQGVAEKIANFSNLDVGSPLFHGCRGWLFEVAIAWDLVRNLEGETETETSAEVIPSTPQISKERAPEL